MLFWGSEDGKRPIFVVAGGEHTVALFGQVPGNQSIVQSYLHLKAGPKRIFSCTCWLHDSVLFLGHFMTNMASTLTVMANYSLQEGMPMELDLEIDLSHLLCPSLVDLVQVVTLLLFLTLESSHFDDLLEVLFILQMMQNL